MGRTLFALFAALALTASASARDLSTLDGKVYSDVTITKITPLGLVFISGGKSGWVDFRDLPPDVQQEFGYDPQRAQAYEQKLVQSNGYEQSAQAQSQAQQIQAPPSQIQQAQQMPAFDSTQYPPEAQPLAQAPEGATVINSADIQSDSDLSAVSAVCVGPACNAYIYYNNMYYPYYYWSHWYHDHHWVWNNGRPYPWTYANHHGVWENGKYYPYEHGRLYQSDNWRQADQDRPQRADNFNRGMQNYHPSNEGGFHGGGGHGGGGGGRR